MAKWGFLTNHALVLLNVAAHPNTTLREISYDIGLTERTVIHIVRALEEEGILARSRDGRRNRYRVDYRAVMRHLSTQTEPFTLEQIASQTALLARQLAEEQDEGARPANGARAGAG